MSPIKSALVTLTGLLTASTALAAGTPAGTAIVNQAQATFSPINGVDRAFSNKVTTIVLPQCSLSLTATGNTSQVGVAGDKFFFHYTLTNAGNDTFTLPVSASLGGGTSAGASTEVYIDQNGNGRVDAGEPKVDGSQTLKADEEAKLIVVVNTLTTAAVSQAEKLTLQLVASCAQGQHEVRGTGTIDLNPPPDMTVVKTFQPSSFKPTDKTRVTIQTTNTSPYESREVLLVDPLIDAKNKGLLFAGAVKAEVKDGAQAIPVTEIEYTTGDPNDQSTAWTTQLPIDVASVTGIRAKAAQLPTRATLTLSFDMQATKDADKQDVLNIARVISSSKTNEGRATAHIAYTPAVRIGPKDKPEANGSDDVQTQPFAVVGEQLCFDHTVKNTGDVVDNYRVTVTYPKGGVQAQHALLTPAGQPLVQPFTLNPDETVPVRICYTSAELGHMEALVTVDGERGTSDPTTDIIGETLTGLPKLVKSFVAYTTDVNNKPITFRNDEEGNVHVGDEIEYTLKVTNSQGRTLTNVEVTDPLPEHVDYVAGSANLGAVLNDRELTWKIPSLASGEEVNLTFKVKVSDKAVDGETLDNLFTMTSTELSAANAKPKSNTVTTPVWTPTVNFNITKTVTPKEATYGETLTYRIVVTNPSQTTDIKDIDLVDKPIANLDYVAGTSFLDGKPISDPRRDGEVMIWRIPGPLKAGGKVELVYKMRLGLGGNPLAESLPNDVKAKGVGGRNSRTVVASNFSRAEVKNKPREFAPLADIVGTVFIDRNRNGLFDKGLDTPVERARVLLAGGRLALTDASGRYHFAQLPYGTYALRLDPTTTPYAPIALPQEGGLSGTQIVNLIGGISSVDFPLAPVGGEAAVKRTTTLKVGNVTLRKEVAAIEGGYVVTLFVSHPTALSGVELVDPLPEGATLREGSNTYSGDWAPGERTLRYVINMPTDNQTAVVTDPTLRWRY